MVAPVSSLIDLLVLAAGVGAFVAISYERTELIF